MSTISRDDLAALIQGFGEQISESRARDRDAAAELRDAAAAEAKADREQQSSNLQYVIKTMSRGWAWHASIFNSGSPAYLRDFGTYAYLSTQNVCIGK